MNLLERVHEARVVGRRAAVLARALAPALPANARVLDIGCGDGRLATALMQVRPDLNVVGVDVLVRSGARIAVEPFDGRSIPFADASFSAALLIDVLHHAEDSEALLVEATRVARRVILKDHVRRGPLAAVTLRFMDRVGNVRHGVRVRGNYLTLSEWQSLLDRVGVEASAWCDRLNLYPHPFRLVFERRLHFLAVLERPATAVRRQRFDSRAPLC